jgi:hypothetical protein
MPSRGLRPRSNSDLNPASEGQKGPISQRADLRTRRSCPVFFPMCLTEDVGSPALRPGLSPLSSPVRFSDTNGPGSLKASKQPHTGRSTSTGELTIITFAKPSRAPVVSRSGNNPSTPNLVRTTDKFSCFGGNVRCGAATAEKVGRAGPSPGLGRDHPVRSDVARTKGAWTSEHSCSHCPFSPSRHPSALVPPPRR